MMQRITPATIQAVQKRLLLFCSMFAVLYAPAVLLLSVKGQAPFLFFASDTYLYLSVARHSVGAPFFTSDGLYPTNGFHPLWQFLLAGLFRLPALSAGPELQMLAVMGLCALLVTLGTALFSQAVYKVSGSFALALFAAVPGFYFLLIAPLVRDYNSPWAYINGMETPLSVFLFGLFLHLAVEKEVFQRARVGQTLGLALLLALLVLARLDDIFFVLPVLGLLAFYARSKKDLALKMIMPLGVLSLCIGGYLLYNAGYAGAAFPVSGMGKQEFSLTFAVRHLMRAFLPLELVQFNPRFSYLWAEESMRALQMCVPLAAAFVWLAVVGRRARRVGWRDYFAARPHLLTISALFLYTAAKGLYNCFFVQFWGTGSWYFPLSVMTTNLAAAAVLASWFRGIQARVGRWVLNTAALLVVILMANAFASNKLLSSQTCVTSALAAHRTEINAAVAAAGETIRIIEFDDGSLSYLLDAPVMNGFGYTLDYEAYQAQRTGRLLDVAYQRGFNTIGVLSAGYLSLSPGYQNDSSELYFAVRAIPHLEGEDLSKWKLSLLYRDPSSGLILVNFRPAPGG
jgi:hypothetical protein